MDDQIAPIRPTKFWIAYKPLPNGEHAAEEWVEWVKKGDHHAPTTADKVSRAMKDASVWQVLERYYEAWKKGQDAEVIGTPLAALSFMTPEVIEALKGVRIQSAEDFAAMEDAQIARTGIPGLRGLQQRARAYVDVQKNQAPVAEELAALRAAVEQLQAEKAEAMATADAMASEAGRRRRTKAEAMGEAA
jgi:hypothetical protein